MDITYCDFGSVACAGGYSFRKDKRQVIIYPQRKLMEKENGYMYLCGRQQTEKFRADMKCTM